MFAHKFVQVFVQVPTTDNTTVIKKNSPSVCYKKFQNLSGIWYF